MSVINIDNISGISSITSDSSSAIRFYNSSGTETLGNIKASDVALTTINSGPISGTRNIIINGAMDINQRGFTGTAGTTLTAAYVTDRFRLEHSHDGVVSAGQTALTSGNAYADGFQNALILRVTTADASLSAAQYQQIQQRIEGFNVQGIKKGTANALPVTLSFWVRSTTTGTYIAELEDIDNTRQVSKAYTINVANTWEKKVLTFPADSTGVFGNDNDNSLEVTWWVGAGSTFTSGTLNTSSWAGITTANRAVGQVNLLGTINNNFWLTGVQLEVGSTATSYERRSYGQELALCQRYYHTASGIRFMTIASNNVYDGFAGPIGFPVSMRAIPTVSISGTKESANTGITDVREPFVGGFSMLIQSLSGTVPRGYSSLTYTASIEL